MLPASEVLAVLRRNGLTAHGYQCVRSWPGDDHSYHPAGYDDLAEWQSRPDARRLGRVKIPDGAKRLRVRLQRGPGQPPPQTHSDRPCLAVLSEFPCIKEIRISARFVAPCSDIHSKPTMIRARGS